MADSSGTRRMTLRQRPSKASLSSSGAAAATAANVQQEESIQDPQEQADNPGSASEAASTGQKRRGSAAKGPPPKKPRSGVTKQKTTVPVSNTASQVAPIPVTLDRIDVPTSTATVNINRWLEATKDGKIQLAGPTPPLDVSPLRKIEKEAKAKQAKADFRKVLFSSNMEVTDMDKGKVYNDRAFEVVEVVKSVVDRQPAAVAGSDQSPDVTEVEIWTIWVEDRNHPGSGKLQVYGETPPLDSESATFERLGGPLETSFCQSEEDAKKLGECVCILMNRFPGGLSEDTWNSGRREIFMVHQKAVLRFPWPRRIVESLALDVWQPGFDYRQLYGPYRDPASPAGLQVIGVGSPAIFQGPRSGHRLCRSFVLVCEGFEQAKLTRQSDLSLEIHLDVTKVDFAKIRDIDPVSPHALNVSRNIDFKGLQLAQDRRDLLLRLLNHLELSIVGKIGSLAALRTHLDSIIHQYSSQKRLQPLTPDWAANKTARHRKGPFRGSVIWSLGVRRSGGKQSGPMAFMPSVALADSVIGEMPRILTYTQSNLQLAYIANQILSALRVGRDIPNAWQAGVVGADMVDLGEIDTESIIALQCLCSSDKDRESNCHVCAICCSVQICDSMITLEDGRMVCRSHVPHAPPPSAVKPGTNRPRTSDQDAAKKRATVRLTKGYLFTFDLRTLSEAVEAPWLSMLHAGFEQATHTPQATSAPKSTSGWPSPSFLLRRMGSEPHIDDYLKRTAISKLQTHLHESLGTYTDAYYGERVWNPDTVNSVVTQTVAGSSTSLKDPMRPTGDAVKTLVIVGDQVFVHHPSNIVVTASFLNYLKWIWAASIIPIARAAALLTLAEMSGKQRDPAAWQSVNLAFDHIHYLTFLTPYKRQTRFKLLESLSVREDDIARLTSAWRSGTFGSGLPFLFSPTTPMRLQPKSAGEALFESRRLENILDPEKGLFEGYGWGTRREETKVLSREQRDEIKRRCTPWTPDDVRNLVDLIDQIEEDQSVNPNRLRMPRGAGKAPWPFRIDHLPQDELDLWQWWYYELASRYLRMLGVCNFRHDTDESPATLLVAIVVQWYRNNGGIDQYIHTEMTIWEKHPQRFSIGRDSSVQPGSPMRSGCLVPMPTSFRDHYDAERRTIVIQPWFINEMWSNFPPTMHAQLLNALAQTLAETEHYGVFTIRSQLPYPKETLVSRTMRRKGDGSNALPDDETETSPLELEDEEPSLEGDDVDEDPEAVRITRASGGNLQQRSTNMHATLKASLKSYKEGLEARGLNLTSDEALAALLSQMQRSADAGDTDGYFRVEAEVQAHLAAAGAGSRPPNKESNCRLCKDPDLEGSMVACSGTHAGTFMMHFWCAALDQMPPVNQPIYCPTCKSNMAGGGSDDANLPRNMPNVGGTCFVSSSVQIMRSLPECDKAVRDITLVCKPWKDSGRSITEFLTNADERRYAHLQGKERDAEREKANDRRMKVASDLALELRHVAHRLGHNKPGDLERVHVTQLHDAIKAWDPDEYAAGQYNDSVALLVELLNCLTLVNDTSTSEGRDALSTLNEIREIAVQDKTPQPLLKVDSADTMNAFKAEGKTSSIVDLFISQTVVERQCPDTTCLTVTRSMEHQVILTLSLPEIPAPAEQPDTGEEGQQLPASRTQAPPTFSLNQMLQNWANEAMPNGVRCPIDDPKNPTHQPQAERRYRLFTVTPEYLIISFNRYSPDPKLSRMDHVDIPEFMDVTECSRNVVLPSEQSRPGTAQIDLGGKNIYRLVGINMFVPSETHYIACVTHNGRWVAIDDLKGRAGVRPSHPQVAINQGCVPYYVVYARQSGRKALPLGSDGAPTQGFILTRRGGDPGPKVNSYSYAPIRTIACPMFGCTQLFETQEEAHAHSLIHQDDDGVDLQPDSGGMFQCDTCNESFNTYDELTNHQSAHQAQHTCTVCSQTFHSAADLENHVHTAHPAQHTCTICSQTFGSAADLENHVNVAHPKPHCSECNEFFHSDEELAQHETLAHRCSTCNGRFTGPEQLAQHHQSAHTVHQCEECGLSVGSKDELDSHMHMKHPTSAVQSVEQQLEALRKATRTANEAVSAMNLRRAELLDEAAKAQRAHEARERESTAAHEARERNLEARERESMEAHEVRERNLEARERASIEAHQERERQGVAAHEARIAEYRELEVSSLQAERDRLEARIKAVDEDLAKRR